MSYRHRRADLYQEEDLVPRRGVVAFIAAVIVVSAVVLVWMSAVVSASFHALRPSGIFPEQDLGPRRPVAGIRESLFDERGQRPLLAKQRAVLESWGWIDRDHGIVRVPIEEAMDIIVEGGRRER